MKSILVATDGSPSATEAVAFGVELAVEHEAQLTFVHVVPMVDVVAAAGFGAIGGAFPHEPSEHDRTLLDDAAAVAGEHGSPPRPRCFEATPSTRSWPTPTLGMST